MREEGCVVGLEGGEGVGLRGGGGGGDGGVRGVLGCEKLCRFLRRWCFDWGCNCVD